MVSPVLVLRRSLIRAAHKRGMLVMLDIVPNHMGADSISADPPDYADFVPFNKEEHFHTCNGGGLCNEDCTIRGSDYEIRNCKEVGVNTGTAAEASCQSDIFQCRRNSFSGRRHLSCASPNCPWHSVTFRVKNLIRSSRNERCESSAAMQKW
jgi:hypothetical protein